MTTEGDIATQNHKPIWRYDVFLCFRGETRHTFTGNLYNALCEKKIKTFMDDEGLESGDDISAIHKAIEESRITIVVFSKDFASSTYCLNEVVKILECRKKKKNQLVWSIFYDVDPSVVSCDSETACSYENALAKLKEDKRFANDHGQIQKWRSSLSDVVALTEPSWHLNFGDQYEYEYIETIVKEVIKTVPCCNVFLSFLGRDTRYSFVDFLHDALSREGRFEIAMHNDQEPEDGNANSQEIEKSQLSIIVFSENYAYSSMCLDELIKILECMKMKNQLVWPIFYKVESSDLRHQTNSYGKAMIEYNRLGTDPHKVTKWRSALSEVANLKACHLKAGYEYEVIEKIVKLAIDTLYMP